MDSEQTREAKVESLRKWLRENAAPQDIIDRFEEIHPVPAKPRTLEEALIHTYAASLDSQNIPQVGPWYVARSRLNCKLQYRIEHVIKDLI